MLMEHNVLRSNWPAMGEHDYPAGSHPTVEQQHFPSLAPSFHGYAPYAPSSSSQRFKDDASPRTFSSLHLSHPHHHPHAFQPPPSSSGGDSHHAHHFSSSVLGSQLPLPHHHSLPLSLSIPRPSTAAAPASTSASKKASEEERKAKHREAQRRFVKRKKAEMLQLKQFAVELELQYQLLEVLSECAALEHENRTLESDIAVARDQAKHSNEQQEQQQQQLEPSEDVVKCEHPPIQLPELKFHFAW